MSFENYKYSVDKDPYEWCLRKPKRLKAIDPQMNIQMRNHKLLTQMPGELEHAVIFRCNQNCTLYDIANELQDIRKRRNIGKHSPYKINGFKEKKPFRVEFKDKPKERATIPKAVQRQRKKVYAIEKVPEEDSPTEDSESDSLGDSIRKQSAEEPDPREEFVVEYQEETPLENREIQLEAGMPKDTANKHLCKHKQDAQKFLVTPTKGMA
ncbi:hypothetical protein O181_073259 [Austropuccinia psidii MF-1]|uniref:Uncharacterized protein n=1 Tax=Austropuccinia psidii MF-1 TaxID=1389203 RepID=A0A9Q3ICA1_9BASI|nr:hypothetical protein [Austropuccinia psidii MF-1]